mmetsp:Transcript_36801/g.57540  ORF Transcript_36801/g.57540 Transcript_36801/m.57540 type:complete len:138 (-) Transcript_36801:78-491(-)
MMYCTGGVRCERASAYLLSKLAPEGGGRDQVFQLAGGIHNYLKTVGPEDGYFNGKNFVFDKRRFEPMHDHKVLGRCHNCEEPHDDYDTGAECRCKECRLLLLLCATCRQKDWPVSKSGSIEELLCGGDSCLQKNTTR